MPDYETAGIAGLTAGDERGLSRASSSRRHDRALLLIAVFKFLKAVLLLAVGFGALGLVHGGVTVVSQRILAVVSSGVERRMTMSLLSRLTRVSPKRLELVGAGAFAYAALFTVEGIGLWLQTRWAEYLTVIATISFIPFEVIELTRRVTAPRVIALVINLVVVVYLVVRLWRRRRGPPCRRKKNATPSPMPFDLQPTLRGSLLTLRPLEASDYDALFAVASDPLIWEQHPDRERHTEARFRVFFDGAIESRGAFIVTDNDTGAVIGSSRYLALDEARREVEIGFSFLARSHWGGRYNAEMKRLMLDHAFQFVDRVVFHVGPENWRSRRAVEKIGGVFAGRYTHAVGREVVVYEIVKGWTPLFAEPSTAP